MSEHYGVLLDEASVTLGDLDITALISQVNHWIRYPTSTDEDLYLRLKNATIVVINKVSLDTSLIESLPRLKLILLTGTGTDRVDLDACREREITVCNVTDYGTLSIAQHVFSLILALSMAEE
jgi:glycerate dehydrogenase